jgi:hypothetical protein
MRAIVWLIDNTSRLAHNRIFRDADQSLCARAWEKQHVSLFWFLWVCAFGKRHCKASFLHYHRRRHDF